LFEALIQIEANT